MPKRSMTSWKKGVQKPDGPVVVARRVEGAEGFREIEDVRIGPDEVREAGRVLDLGERPGLAVAGLPAAQPVEDALPAEGG